MCEPATHSTIGKALSVQLQQNLRTGPQKPESNSKYYHIGIGAAVGLAIGLTIAYFGGATVGVFVAAAVVGAFCLEQE